tara:strand:+ start:913 stop:1470 length:558 start_codon:yes stop_codon:yes gene_type:complete
MKDKSVLSEGLKYHVNNNVPLNENIYRPGSKAFFDIINEARQAYEEGRITVNEDDYDLLKTDIGALAEYKGMVVALDFPILEMFTLDEAEYKGRKVKLNKPKRNSGEAGGKYVVYVRDPKTKKVKKLTFGSRGMSVKLKDPKRRKSFVARHKCKETKDKMSKRYWACRIGRYPHLFGGKQRYTWW